MILSLDYLMWGLLLHLKRSLMDKVSIHKSGMAFSIKILEYTYHYFYKLFKVFKDGNKSTLINNI